MKNSITRAKELLSYRRKTPKMYASCQESYVTMIATVLEMLDINYNVQDFYAKHLGTYGNLYIGAMDPVKDDWAHLVVDDAIRMIEEYEQGKKEV